MMGGSGVTINKTIVHDYVLYHTNIFTAAVGSLGRGHACAAQFHRDQIHAGICRLRPPPPLKIAAESRHTYPLRPAKLPPAQPARFELSHQPIYFRPAASSSNGYPLRRFIHTPTQSENTEAEKMALV